MAKNKLPGTPAIRMLKMAHVDFKPCPYPYEDHGGTETAARELAVDEHAVIKTLVMETEDKEPLIVLMHGDKKVSTKNLARIIGTRSVTPCPPQEAQKHTGYMVGGTSPFGTRKRMSVYMEKSIAALSTIYINGGKRGLLLEMAPSAIIDILAPTLITVAIDEGGS